QHWSPGSPAVGLLVEFQVHEGFGAGDGGDFAHLAEDLQQVVVVFADDLHEKIERSRGDHDVVEFVYLGQLAGYLFEVAAALDADHGLPVEAQRHWVGHRDDLDDAAVDQKLHALPDAGLGQADRLPDRGVGTPPVLLQLLDDQLGHFVEGYLAGPGTAPPSSVRCGGHGRCPWRVSHVAASFTRPSRHGQATPSGSCVTQRWWATLTESVVIIEYPLLIQLISSVRLA